MDSKRSTTREAQWSAWMLRAQAGDRHAYERLLSSLLPDLTGYVRARLRDASLTEDVVQNVLLSIHRARHTYRAERAFSPWLWAIARNAVIDAHRMLARRRRREVPVEGIELPADPPSAPTDQPLSPRVLEALEKLPRAQREAVQMVQLEGLSVAEAAERAGTTAGALKVRAHRGYRALRALLERRDP